MSQLKSFRPSTRSSVGRFGRLASSLLLGLMLAAAGHRVVAQTASPEVAAPPEVLEAIASLDAAASQEDLQGVLTFYSPNLVHGDGLTYSTLEEALTAFWEKYDDLAYQTELTAWEETEDGYVTETTTTVTGVQPLGNRNLTLTSTLTSRQRFVDEQIVEQTILAEESQFTLGDNPPNVEVNLPEEVGIGQQFYFDAIVLEPLGDRILLGAALEEPASPEGYVADAPVELELLSAGGLFKVGRAPATPGSRWVSAVIIREDGITAITRRFQVVSNLIP
ncbi:MAG: nuclear transport factor 2 family protein [Synechococcales bacterium]|nr:nuclear transport factor 2 family protein [Synechococcales bacterium]